MTDRLKGFVVTLERDIREDDAEPILNAIRQLRGVLSVEPLKATFEDAMAYERARHELGEQLWHVLYPKKKGE